MFVRNKLHFFCVWGGGPPALHFILLRSRVSHLKDKAWEFENTARERDSKAFQFTLAVISAIHIKVVANYKSTISLQNKPSFHPV